MADILPLINIPLPPDGRKEFYVPCPRCDNGRDKHLNINLQRDVFRCPRCGFNGGIFDLYAEYTQIPRGNVKRELERLLGGAGNADAKPGGHIVVPQSVPAPVQECALAPIDVRHAVYLSLLRNLSLAGDHRQNLQSRGLTNDVIDRHGYKTTPVFGFTALAKMLMAEGLTLDGVPGFYHNEAGQWAFVQEQRGILIPVRDIQGRIQGLQIRRDNVSKRKYRWISSSGRLNGCRCEGWTHFVGPIRERILLIEGPLKADVVYHLTGQSLLAVPGVNALLHLENALKLLRESGVDLIDTAFDMDFMNNWYVQNGYSQLTALLVKLGFRYRTKVWDPEYNGLDDYLWQSCLKRGLAPA